MSGPVAQRLILTVAASAGLFACAHSNLRLEVDVYRGDPLRELTLTPEQLGTLRRELDNAERNIASDLARQEELARRLFEIYGNYFCLHSRLRNRAASCDRDRLKELQQLLHDHLATLEARKGRVTALLDTARASVADYERLLETPRPARDSVTRLALQAGRMRARVSHAADSVKAFASAPATDFQGSLTDQWTFVVESLDKNQALVAAADSAPIRVLRGQVAELANQLRATAPALASDLEMALKSTTGAGGLNASLEIIARKVNTLPEAVSLSSSPAVGLARLAGARELFDSQVDRLKDPADPVWRIVSAPENSAHWSQIFTKTWFYAQGKSDVIVVRDGPLDYRVQNASNNPVALVASQLQISRAVTNAALTVLRATLAPSVAQVGALDPGAPPESPDFSAAEDMARRDARLDEIHRQRALASRTTQVQLRAIAAQLSAGPTGASRARLLQQLQGTVEGYRDLLTSLRLESPDGRQEDEED